MKMAALALLRAAAAIAERTRVRIAKFLKVFILSSLRG
jgi:hypothetical protein